MKGKNATVSVRRNPAQSVSESMLSIFMNNMANSIHWKKMNFKWVGFTKQKTKIETEDIKGIVYLSYLFVFYFLKLFFSTVFFFSFFSLWIVFGCHCFHILNKQLSNLPKANWLFNVTIRVRIVKITKWSSGKPH